ncbi:unnamed protein product [Rhizoctonia solani]|uniref:F-box domain-containing protein n=1 Tax=Rhizoctonia solani TaxID=456999 RepID=A0A8H3GVB3_9AGAM|nr:unnamed protein product [Rhizoctonia solani]
MNMSDSSSCATVKQWEEASTSLVAAFKHYTDLCVGLSNGSLRGGIEWNDLVPRIDSTLGVTHERISHYLGESNRALTRVRNKFASPLFRLPQDVLREILLNVVFDRDNPVPFSQPSMERDTWFIYHRLYNLIGVCSAWRDMIMANGTFWSVIPMIPNTSAEGERPFELHLQRAGESTLYLAVNLESSMSSRDFAVVLAEHGSRFRTINITTGDTNTIRDIINRLLKQGRHGALSELFIQSRGSRTRMHRIPGDPDYIVSHDPPLSHLMQSLRAFRIRRVNFHWNTISFSSRLVELHIEHISLGYDDAIAPWVQVLSSATNLRELKIIDVSTFHGSGTTGNSASLSPVTFPALQSLFIKNLYLNTLKHLLPMIVPGTHRLILFLSRNSLGVNTREGGYFSDSDEYGETIDYDSLRRLLEHTVVDTLMTTGSRSRGGEWLTRFELTGLLKSMPTLKTLKLNQWKIGKDLCKSLTQTYHSRASSKHVPLPELRNLHLSSVEICDDELFQKMISSRSLYQLMLGGYSQGSEAHGRMYSPLDQALLQIQITEDSGIVRRLRENMPELDLRLVGPDECPVEFSRSEWRLW